MGAMSDYEMAGLYRFAVRLESDDEDYEAEEYPEHAGYESRDIWLASLRMRVSVDCAPFPVAAETDQAAADATFAAYKFQAGLLALLVVWVDEAMKAAHLLGRKNATEPATDWLGLHLGYPKDGCGTDREFRQNFTDPRTSMFVDSDPPMVSFIVPLVTAEKWRDYIIRSINGLDRRWRQSAPEVQAINHDRPHRPAITSTSTPAKAEHEGTTS